MSWLQDAEVTLPKTPAELLAEAQSAKIVEINAAYTAIAEPIVRDYPEVETKSWDQQKADAEAYLAWHEDQEGEPPTLLVLPGILRGRNGTDGTETLYELSLAVRRNALAFAEFQEMTGVRQRLVKAVREAETVEGVNAIQW